MADVVVNPESTDFNDLYGKGIRAYVLQDYESAVLAFSKSSELLAKKHDNDLHDELGEVYLYYGKALLQLSRKQSSPLGDGVPKEEESEEEAENLETIKEELSEDVEMSEEVEGNEDKKDESLAVSEDKEEELTDLQVAWEVLELAKKIFTKRGDSGLKNLAETLIILGEISLESNMFTEGIEDMRNGLEIQKKVFGKDSRVIAETFYKIGMALGPNEQEEAVSCFTSCIEYLKNRLEVLGTDEANKEEVEDINALLPEIEEKINDVKSFKEEVAQQISNTIGKREVCNASNGSASSSKVNDISHLVKRKRKSEDDKSEQVPAKKPNP